MGVLARRKAADLPWLSKGAWDGTRRLTTEEQEWERDVAGVVMRAVRVGLVEPAMELMCKHSLLGPSIVKELQVAEKAMRVRNEADLDSKLDAAGVELSQIDTEMERLRRRMS